MKKTLLALLSATLVFTVITPAQAEDQKVLAIIDTAVNYEKHPAVIYEACFASTALMGCSNKSTFMEGKGSASSVWPKSINNKTYHGDSMVKAALVVNSNIKIVFVRVADVDALGNSIIRSESLVSAISWVSKNAEKYSIDAVSISLSGVNTTLDVANTTNKVVSISPDCTNKTVIDSVSYLNLKNIPTFAATGNDKSTTIVGFPACISGVVGVGAVKTATEFEATTNRGPGLDIVAIGSVTVNKYGMGSESEYQLAGSSGANVVTASRYINKNVFKTFSEYINSLSKTTISGVLYSYSS